MQMAVESKYQGQGIGGKIVQLLHKVVKERGYTEITCHAREEAVQFYEKHNYEIVGEPFEEAEIWHRHMIYSV